MSVANEINRIIEAKNAIKTAIESKGGSVGDSIDTYASAISDLQTGGGGADIPDIADTDPLTFVCICGVDDEGSWLSLDDFGSVNSKSFYYDINDTGEKLYTPGTHIQMKVGDLVRFKSTSTLVISSSTEVYRQFKTHGIFKCGGNIMSMFGNQTNFSTSNMSYACYSLFRDCTIVSAPKLPSTTLANYCYNYMFYGCPLLQKAPELPATTLANYCYQYMFSACKSLTTPPSILPATTLASYCYSNMFGGCTSLTTAPALPATTLANYCYNYMFSGCTSLTTAPALPATTLATYCYNYMFSGCTSLTTPPSILPATTLATYCYYYMFRGCTSLTTAPELPATTLANYCYAYMFYGCTSLTTAPALPATTLETYCYEYMFSGCTSLTTAPALPATTLAYNCYQYMFQKCSKLNYVKAMFTTTPGTNYTNNWLTSVSSKGTFVKNSAATWKTTGVSAVPTGWTIEYADS